MRHDRIPLLTGDEFDALTGWREAYGWHPGQLAKIKRRYRRRVRHAARLEYGAMRGSRKALDRTLVYASPGLRVVFFEERGGRAHSVGAITLTDDAVLRIEDGVAPQAEILLAEVDQADVAAVTAALCRAAEVFRRRDGPVWAVAQEV